MMIVWRNHEAIARHEATRDDVLWSEGGSVAIVEHGQMYVYEAVHGVANGNVACVGPRETAGDCPRCTPR